MTRSTRFLICLTFVVLSLLAPIQTISGDSEFSRKFGVGFQAAPFPIFGVGVIYNVNEMIGLQVFGRKGIDVDHVSARALFRFKREPNYNLYASALVGTFRDDDVSTGILQSEQTDEALGFGIGVGYERFFSRIPSVGFNVEANYIRIGFEDKWWEYDYKTPDLIMVGGGVNYYFF